MKFHEIWQMLQRYEIGWPLKCFEPELSLHPQEATQSSPALAVLTIKFTSPDRDTGVPNTRRFVVAVNPLTLNENTFFSWLDEHMLLWIKHELYESLMVDGVRHRDPHAGDKR